MVPGATVLNPKPNPETISFHNGNALLFIVIKTKVCDKTFTLQMAQGIFKFHQLPEQIMHGD
jgi:hypothetical protein